jgi:hypothetical protein
MALTDSMTTEEIANSEARYALHITPETAGWFAGFAAGFKGSKSDRAAFGMVAGALLSSHADGNVPDETTGQTLHALYLPLFDADGVSCEAHMSRVADVIGKRSGRSKADKAAIAELRAELTGAMADMEIRPVVAPPVTAGTDTQDTQDTPDVAPAPVKARRTRKAKPAPAPVAEESDPVAPAPVVAPGDAVADIAVKVGAMINKWSQVKSDAAKMTRAQRDGAAAELARDFALCVAMQADADGAGNSLGALDGDANRIMHAARKLLRDAYAFLSGNPKCQGDRLPRGVRHTFRKAVAPWRADATAALPSAQ